MIHLNEKLIALTFDDGPNTSTSMQVLDILEKYSVAGTFFLIGQNITPEAEDTVRREISLGCEVENHSLTHRPLTELTAEEMIREVKETSERITGITGKAPRFFRPPYIAVSGEVFENVPLDLICGRGCNDWDNAVSTEERFETVTSKAAHGEIILLHDSEGNINTVKALDMIIPKLIKDGFTFVTVSRLFEACGVSPQKGHMYTNVLQD